MQKKICNPTFCESKRYWHTGHQNVCCWPCMLWHLPWQTWLQQDITLLNASIVNVSELMIAIFDVFDPSLYSWRHYALLRSSSGMLSLFVFVKTCQIYQHEVILAWPKIPHIYHIILDHSHKSIETFHALHLPLALLIIEVHDDSSVWIVCIKLCVYTCWCDAYMWYKRISTPQVIHL